MDRSPTSRKGQNGVVAIIGGSKHMHGAPIFSALAAEASGVDLIYPCVPECNAEVTKIASPNFIVTPFHGNDLSTSDVSILEEVLSQSTVAVIGPGLETFEKTQEAMKTLITEATIPLVLDASALQTWTFDAVSGKSVVLTPHIGELGRMQGQVLDHKTLEECKDLVCTIAKTRNHTMILKGASDIISSAEICEEVQGGNAGLTVGGTGDVLAGLIAGLIAQGIESATACHMATTIIKRAATILFDDLGYAFTAMDVVDLIPHLVHTYDV